MVKVLFIPKPGHMSYVQVKSFQPISLTSFLLKTLERLVDRHIRDGALVKYPLHFHRHAYQISRSGRWLSVVICKIEGALKGGFVALGDFQDNEGAFDSAKVMELQDIKINYSG
jgi:hypothetical protein